MELRFTVYGLPQTAGSKRAFAIRKRGVPTGQVVVTDANKKSAGWKNDVASAAIHAIGSDFALLLGAITLSLHFFFPRPKGHYRTGRKSQFLRDSAAAEHINKPDVLKLARGVEDALTSICWRDDCQIVREILHKSWGEPARVEISINSSSDANMAGGS